MQVFGDNEGGNLTWVQIYVFSVKFYPRRYHFVLFKSVFGGYHKQIFFVIRKNSILDDFLAQKLVFLLQSIAAINLKGRKVVHNEKQGIFMVETDLRQRFIR